MACVCVQSTVDEPGLASIQTEAEKSLSAVLEGRWQDATDYYRTTQYAVNAASNYVDFYNILKFRVFSKGQETNTEKMGGMEGIMSHNWQKGSL